MTTIAHDDVTLGELIDRKRAEGYDPEFEALLSRIWRCPHCRLETTVLNIVLPLDRPGVDPLCPTCDQEGIEPVEPTTPELVLVEGGRK